jgi:lysyl-tRNA synthetase class I
MQHQYMPNIDIPVDDTSQNTLALLSAMWPSRERPPLTYNDLITFAVSTAPRTEWEFWDNIIDRTGYMPQDNHWMDYMVAGAFAAYRSRILPFLHYRDPTDIERIMLKDLARTISSVVGANTEDYLQRLTAEIYECGKRHYDAKELRSFFQAVYEICLGKSEGPRLPNFIALHGGERWVELIYMRLGE